MCPLCIGTATLLVSSGTSAGGLATFLFRRRALKKRRAAVRAAARDGRDAAAAGNRILFEALGLGNGEQLNPVKTAPRGLARGIRDPHLGEAWVHDVLTVTRTLEPALDHFLGGFGAVGDILTHQFFAIADGANAVRR